MSVTEITSCWPWPADCGINAFVKEVSEPPESLLEMADKICGTQQLNRSFSEKGRWSQNHISIGVQVSTVVYTVSRRVCLSSVRANSEFVFLARVTSIKCVLRPGPNASMHDLFLIYAITLTSSLLRMLTKYVLGLHFLAFAALGATREFLVDRSKH